MNPSIAQFHDPARNREVWRIKHDLGPRLLWPWMLARSPVTIGYAAANVAALLVVIWAWRRAELIALDAYSNLCVGMVLGYALLLPVHERIHGLTYRRLGARAEQMRTEYHWRNLTAFCTADRFVVGRAGFWRLCLGPSTVINPPLAALALLIPGRGGLFLAGALLLHIGACSGDVALANWLYRRGRYTAVFTYDDTATRVSYFFEPVDGGIADSGV